MAERLTELAPDGIDVFFDNAGGEQFEAALQAAASNARFVLCGALSGKNNEIAHLLATLVLPPATDPRHRLRWSMWRRRHQARARRATTSNKSPDSHEHP